MKRPEQDLQIAIMDHVRARSMPGTFGFHVPNAGKRSLFLGKKMKEMGVVAGVPDLVFIKRGEVFGLELKSIKGRLTPAQKHAIPAMEEAGAKVAVANNLDEALITLECWGIIRRAA